MPSSVSEPGPGSATRAVVELSRGVRFAELSPVVVQVAKQCVVDWLGVTLAATNEPAVRAVRDSVLEDGSRPQATLLGVSERVASPAAALVNGTAAHALDFDDVLGSMNGHPSAPVLSALAAVAEPLRLSGADFLAAFVAGVEAEARIGLLVAPSHYQRGWHATGTVGTFGATAAVAHATRLPSEQWTHAFGLAGAQAAGLKSMFGTMTKPLHVGKAATNGVLAVRLAARGFTSDEHVLDSDQGFTDVVSDQADVDGSLGPATYAVERVLFKHHASCYFTHASIDGVRALVAEHGLTPASVERIELVVPRQHLRACNIVDPVTPLEAKFSLRFTAVAALSGRSTDESGFTPEAVRDPETRALAAIVSVLPDDGFANRHSALTRLILKDGRTLERHVDMSVPVTGDTDLADQQHRLERKFGALSTPLLGTARASSLLELARRLPAVADVGEFLRLTVPDDGVHTRRQREMEPV